MSAGWIFTDHAKQRRREMHLTEDEIVAEITGAEFETPDWLTYRRADRDNVRRAYGPRLVVVYNAADHVVVTILWRSLRRITRSDGAPNEAACG